MLKCRVAAAVLLAATATGCDKPAPIGPRARPVRAITIERNTEGETVSLTGQVRAKDEVNLAFRLDGQRTALRLRILARQRRRNEVRVDEVGIGGIGDDVFPTVLAGDSRAVEGRRPIAVFSAGQRRDRQQKRYRKPGQCWHAVPRVTG